MTLTGQAATLLSMVLCGIGIGMLYDTYRTLERRCGLSLWLVWVCDLLFWISCTFLVFGTLLRINEGIVRIYIFLGIGIGGISYLLFLQRTYLYILGRMISFILWVYMLLMRLLYYLLIVPIRFLYRALLSILLLLATVLLTVGKWILRPFCWLGLWLWKRAGKVWERPNGKWRGLWRKIRNILTNWIKHKKM
nr:spore cortex biosynthesis protein YabQ [Aneurinibacillus terranovensis]